MANVQASGPKFTIKGANAYYVGDANDTWTGTMCIQFVNTTTFTGTISVKGVCRVKEALDDSVAPVTINYVKIWLNGSQGDQTYVATGITDASLILVPSTGQQIVLDTTGNYTSGVMTVYVSKVSGAAA